MSGGVAPPGVAAAPPDTGSRAAQPRGMVTSELAVALLAVAMIAAFGCWTVGLVAAQNRCADMAHQMARQIARGDDAQRDRIRAEAPLGSVVDVHRATEQVTVRVSRQLSWGRLGPVEVRASAVTTWEPGVGP